MTEEKKTKAFGALALVVVLGLMLWIILGRNCGSPQLVQPVDSVYYWRTEHGKLVASMKGMQIQFQFKEQALADSLAKVYNTKAKWLQEWVLAMTETNTELAPDKPSLVKEYEPLPDVQGKMDPEQCPPVVRRMRQHFQSAYYDAFVQIGDSSYMKLQGRDTVSVVWKIVKEGRLFNRRTLLELDVSTANPDTRVAGLKAYRAGPLKPKRSGIGVQLGYEFDGKRFRPYFGLGYSYNLIRF